MKVLGTGFLALTKIGVISALVSGFIKVFSDKDLTMIFLGDGFWFLADSDWGIKSLKKDLIFCSSFSKTSVLLFL